MFFNHNFSLIFTSYYKQDVVPKIADYLTFLTDEEVKDFVLINFIQYFNAIKKCIF